MRRQIDVAEVALTSLLRVGLSPIRSGAETWPPQQVSLSGVKKYKQISFEEAVERGWRRTLCFLDAETLFKLETVSKAFRRAVLEYGFEALQGLVAAELRGLWEANFGVQENLRDLLRLIESSRLTVNWSPLVKPIWRTRWGLKCQFIALHCLKVTIASEESDELRSLLDKQLKASRDLCEYLKNLPSLEGYSNPDTIARLTGMLDSVAKNGVEAGLIPDELGSIQKMRQVLPGFANGSLLQGGAHDPRQVVHDFLLDFGRLVQGLKRLQKQANKQWREYVMQRYLCSSAIRKIDGELQQVKKYVDTLSGRTRSSDRSRAYNNDLALVKQLLDPVTRPDFLKLSPELSTFVARQLMKKAEGGTPETSRRRSVSAVPPAISAAGTTATPVMAVSQKTGVDAVTATSSPTVGQISYGPVRQQRQHATQTIQQASRMMPASPTTQQMAMPSAAMQSAYWNVPLSAYGMSPTASGSTHAIMQGVMGTSPDMQHGVMKQAAMPHMIGMMRYDATASRGISNQAQYVPPMYGQPMSGPVDRNGQPNAAAAAQMYTGAYPYFSPLS